MTTKGILLVRAARVVHRSLEYRITAWLAEHGGADVVGRLPLERFIPGDELASIYRGYWLSGEKPKPPTNVPVAEWEWGRYIAPMGINVVYAVWRFVVAKARG